MKKWLLVTTLGAVLTLAPATQAEAQGVVRGMVVDENTGLALAGAAVRIDSLNFDMVTDLTGRYVLANLPAGEYEITIRYLGYATAKQRVRVADKRTTALDVRLPGAKTNLGAVVIQGLRTGQAAALTQQKTAEHVTNVVASDQIGRFPDANIGDAMKRIPGITVMNDQGEARFGLIRGTEPRLNSVTINGERIPSAEPEVREVQLDLIPADMVQAVEVSKTLTADMDADAIGGSVNIITRSAPPERRVSLTLGSGYNLLSDKAMGVASGVIGQRFANGRLGVIVSGSYLNHYLGSDDVEGVWDQTDEGQVYLDEFQIREYRIQRLRRSFSSSFDYRLGENTLLTLRSTVNQRQDWENRFRLTYELGEPDADGVSEEATIIRETKGGGPRGNLKNARLEDQRMQSHSLSGQHLLGHRVITNWSVAYSRATEMRPDERYVSWETETAVQSDISDEREPAITELDPSAVTPSAFAFRRVEKMDQKTVDSDMNARLDILVPLRDGYNASSVKVGVRWRNKDKMRRNTFWRAEPLSGMATMADGTTADYTNPDFLAGDYQVGRFSTPKYLSGLDVYNAAQFELEDRPDEWAPANYEATENIGAGYVQFNQSFGATFAVLAGLRVEHTNVDYTGNEFDADEEVVTPRTGKSNYTNLLPMLNARWSPRDETVVRFAWTNTLARPNYYDLVPYRIVSVEDSELAVGNPDLRPTKSMNFDLMVEHYFQSVGLVSAGVFYKDIRDFIFEYTQRNAVDPVSGGTFDEISRPQNGSNASLTGFEMAFQRQLDFLPRWGRYVGVYSNYTYTNSSVDGLNIEGRENEKMELPGTAKHSGNVSLSLDMPRFSVRTSANFQGSFIDPGELGDAPFYDRYYDRSVNVDANVSYAFTSKARLFLEANNLTNQPLRYYQGVRARVMQNEFYDRRFTFGIKYDF